MDNITASLAKRLSVWDAIDKAYASGLVVEAHQLTELTKEFLTPRIRRGLGL